MSKQPPQSKKTLTLDLNSPRNKRPRTLLPQQHPHIPVLTTPDVQMLKLSSPEMAKFLTSNPNLATPTPSGYLFPKNVTEEQALYAKGFEDALNTVRQGDSSKTVAVNLGDNKAVAFNINIATIERATAAHRASATVKSNIPVAVQDLPVSRPSSSSSGSMDSQDGYRLPEGIQIKEEAEDSDDSERSGIGSNDGNFKPINMASQEEAKLERKRLRNRIAATKCRKRKLDRIANLDEKVVGLKEENSELASVVKRLRAAVCDLKQEVMEHVNQGCQIMISSEGF